jgi:type I restriction-modification system DNA methylase subunit
MSLYDDSRLQGDLFELQKGLFWPAAVKEALNRTERDFPPRSAQERLKRWQNQLASPERRPELSEAKHKAGFLGDIFEGLLGFATAGSADAYHMEYELSAPGDTRPADAALGIFGKVPERRVRGIIEVKGPGVDLDARSTRKDNLSPVDQAFLYANKFESVWWVIVTNFDEIRLYHHQRGAIVHERFLLQKLTGEEFTRFHFLLRRENLLGDAESTPETLRLAREKWRAQAEVSKKFYAEYQDTRVELFRELREQNPDVEPTHVLESTQLLLDRLLFILFCVDRGLLPHDVIEKVRWHGDQKKNLAYGPGSLWEALRSLFRAIDTGRKPAGISPYNGGLFAEAKLDHLDLDDRTGNRESFVLERLLEWDRLDFESEIDVDILGHIFENSISDLEQLRQEIASDPESVRLNWRNREGIFYTPEWVTRYIVRHTVGRLLEERPEDAPDLQVLDPACGSGAFLTQMLPLLRENLELVVPEEVEKVREAREEDELTLFNDPNRLEPRALYEALRRTVYGVDKSRDSVEITKLSFWLQTVVQGKPLPTLDENIRFGNSLCDDPDVVDDPFDWSEELPEIASNGATAVVGNPPWVTDPPDYANCLEDRFELAGGQYDLAFVFMELALTLLEPGGYLGFIIPDSILINKETEDIRRLLAEENTLHEVIKLGEGVFPGVFRGSSIIVVEKGPPPEDHTFAGLIVTKGDRQQITDVANNVNLDVLMSERGNTVRLPRILENERAEFDIFVGEEDEELLSKIESHPIDWDELVEHGRGVELNREGHVIQCPNCMRWDAPPAKKRGVYSAKTCTHCGHEYEKEDAASETRIIAGEGDIDAPETRPFVDGSDVNRYRIEDSRLIDTGKDGINYKDRELYESPKIVFRQAGIGITATIDFDHDAYVPQSVYLFRLQDDLEGDADRYRLPYLLGVLNSRVMLYYYFKKTGQIEWQSYPRWTLGRVTDLPIRAIDWDDPEQVRLHDAIAEEVERLIRQGASGDPDEDLEVERKVMELYGLTPSERQRIWETLRSVQELKVIREVLPPAQPSLGA